MSKKANPTAIGIFLFAGLVLGVAGVFLFTSSKLFTHTGKFIVYFENTLNGLSEGAPVKYRGVTIGSVSGVMIHYNQTSNDLAMPVIIEIQEELIRKKLVGATIFKGLEHLGEEVRKGLRAKLASESFVTGVLYVELDVEDPPPPAVYHQVTPVFIEIPSRPTEIQQLKKSLAKLDVAALQNDLSSLLTRADKLLASVKMDDINRDLTNVLASANRVVTNPDLTNAFTSLKDTLVQFQGLATNLDHRVDILADGLTNTLQRLDQTLVQTRGGMENFRELLAADSVLRSELNGTLEEVTQAAQSVSAFADYLHRHPNALLTGRKPVTEKKP